MKYDPHYNPFPSRRNIIYGSRGMVATSHPLAAQAGLEILKQGGNAVDAAIATAAALTVVEPTSNGLGSDCFAIIWKDGRLHGMNGSGRAPLAFKLKEFQRRGWQKVPECGWASATVPAAPKGWATLAQSMGRLKLAQSLAPAVSYASRGHAVAPTVALNWRRCFEGYKKTFIGKEFEPWFDTFAPGGRTPDAGELWKNPDQAKTLELIGTTDAKAFYEGEISEKILNWSMTTGGYLCEKDLLTCEPEWVDPISVNYRGYDVWEIPPNGQGITVLMALNILKGFDFISHDDAAIFHRQIEAMKLAFADSLRYVADPRFESVPVEGMLADDYASRRRGLIGDRARLPEAGKPEGSGTVYLCTADEDGCMVSFIQSNYTAFGSGIVIPGTGISLNCRAKGFTMDPNHPNVIAPGKRPYCTIIPGFLTKDGAPVGPFGVMGAFMQPQGQLQLLMNVIDFHLNPQQA
ncbi:MAG: gamma-glutamyltransferase family protein, partial [Pyramidobacter sp.]|nr:gamma-glutamyltransferase family protein [Pyramidobacter sp.]